MNPLSALVITIVMCGGKLKNLLVFDEMHLNQDQKLFLNNFWRLSFPRFPMKWIVYQKKKIHISLTAQIWHHHIVKNMVFFLARKIP
jgi:hypothetical protein